jgi:tetratricopeptide (TPR) repeat protein
MSYTADTTPEQESHLAREALGTGDLHGAFSHAARGLQLDPRNEEALGLLQQIYRKASDPLGLVPAQQAQSDSLKAAIRAWLLAELQRWDEAFTLLSHVLAARPDRPFLTWAAEWLKRPGVAGRLPPEVVEKILLPSLSRFLSEVPVPMADDDVRAENVRAAAKVIEAIHVVMPNSTQVLFARSLVSRRLGQFEHAFYFAYQAFQNEQTWKNAIGAALAYRDAGKIDEAIGWYKHALSLDDDVTTRLEVGDTYLDAQRWDDAIRAYQAVLEREAEQPWAEASLAYARFKKTGEESHKLKLAEMAEESGRAWSLLCAIEPPQPYLHTLPPAADATANALRGVIRQLAPDPTRAEGGTVTLNVTHPESPSVLNAFRLWAQSRDVNVAVELQVEKLQSPDPRVPKAPVDFTLWQYDGHTPSPAVDAADPRLAAAIGLIAQNPYNLELYDTKAKELLERIKLPRDLLLPHFTATMVHPPPLPNPNQDPIEWILRVQMACALLIARLDDGWNPSIRKRALFSLIMGPVDWLVDAALLVLGWLGRDNPEIHAEANQMFSWMATQIPKEGYTCYEYPLACAWLLLGGHDDATRDRLTTWKEAIEARGRTAPDAGPEEEIHDGLTLDEYAEFSAWRDLVLDQHGVGTGGEAVAPAGAEVYKRLETLCRDFNIDPSVAYGQHGAPPGHVPGWDRRIKGDPHVAEAFFARFSAARQRLQASETGDLMAVSAP